MALAGGAAGGLAAAGALYLRRGTEAGWLECCGRLASSPPWCWWSPARLAGARSMDLRSPQACALSGRVPPGHGTTVAAAFFRLFRTTGGRRGRGRRYGVAAVLGRAGVAPALVAPPAKPRGGMADRLSPRLRVRIPAATIATMAIFYIAYMSFFAVRNHHRFNTFTWDLGQIDNQFYNFCTAIPSVAPPSSAVATGASFATTPKPPCSSCCPSTPSRRAPRRS